MDVVSLGEIILDMFPAETGRGFSEVSAFLPVPGGAPANVAVAASRLGLNSAFIGKVGDDPFGERLTRTLEQSGVDVRGMRHEPNARTTLNFMTLPDANTTECLFYRNPGADAMLRSDELDRALISSARFFHFGSVSLTREPSRSATLEAARQAREAGAIVSFDVNYRPTLWPDTRAAIKEISLGMALAHLLKVNEGELVLLAGTEDPGKGCGALLQKGPELCVATLGPKGSFFATRTARGAMPGFSVRTVDATGCGDAFVAAFLHALGAAGAGQRNGKHEWGHALEVGTLSSALAYSNAAGALTATKKGVMSALPTGEEVEAFLRRQSHGDEARGA